MEAVRPLSATLWFCISRRRGNSRNSSSPAAMVVGVSSAAACATITIPTRAQTAPTSMIGRTSARSHSDRVDRRRTFDEAAPNSRST